MLIVLLHQDEGAAARPGCRPLASEEVSVRGHQVVGAPVAEGKPPLADGIHLMNNQARRGCTEASAWRYMRQNKPSTNRWQLVRGYSHRPVVLRTRLIHIRVDKIMEVSKQS